MPPETAEEQGTLLDDLLETSERLLHLNIATIQQVFADQYRKTFDEELAEEPAEADLSLTDQRVTERLAPYRAELRRRQQDMIEEQRLEWAHRNQQIIAFCENVTPAS